MSFDFSTLITDRAAADLENLRALLSTPMEDWTAAQLAQFNQAISKGAYNYTDLNRVTACMEYLDETLKSYGYETGYQRIVVHPEEPPGPVNPLPEGYMQLEYIQSSGSQYINTGVLVSEKTGLLFEYQQNPETVGCICGCDQGWMNSGIIIVNNIISFGGTSSGAALGLNDGVKHQISLQNGVFKKDGAVIFTGSGVFSSSVPFCLFALNRNGALQEYSSVTMWSFKIYNADECVRNYMPCKNPSGEIGMYDLVNNQFYENAGTGEFIAGPEVPRPEPTLDPYTWYESDIPTASQLAQYLSNVLSIWSTIMGDPTLPETMVNLTQEGANQIEAALIEINTAIEQIIAAMARSNSFTFWSGNRPFPTAYSNPGRNWAELDAMGTSWRNWQVANWYLLLYGNLEAEGDVT